ncbi:MAG: hypothetical protein ACFBSC_05930, partial [Microcoleaceae cyanobacterium]
MKQAIDRNPPIVTPETSLLEVLSLMCQATQDVSSTALVSSSESANHDTELPSNGSVPQKSRISYVLVVTSEHESQVSVTQSYESKFDESKALTEIPTALESVSSDSCLATA